MNLLYSTFCFGYLNRIGIGHESEVSLSGATVLILFQLTMILLKIRVVSFEEIEHKWLSTFISSLFLLYVAMSTVQLLKS